MTKLCDFKHDNPPVLTWLKIWNRQEPITKCTNKFFCHTFSAFFSLSCQRQASSHHWVSVQQVRYSVATVVYLLPLFVAHSSLTRSIPHRWNKLLMGIGFNVAAAGLLEGFAFWQALHERTNARENSRPVPPSTGRPANHCLSSLLLCIHNIHKETDEQTWPSTESKVSICQWTWNISHVIVVSAGEWMRLSVCLSVCAAYSADLCWRGYCTIWQLHVIVDISTE